MTHLLRAEGVTLGYDQTPIIENLDLAIVPGAITVIVGANASGKSTLLKGLSRLITPDAGQVTLGGRNITALPGKKVATVVGLLPQQPVAPDGITVADLVGRGRYPHQGWFRQWSSTDDEIVAAAASGSFPVTIEHAFGETTIDEQPTRVVAWGWGSADDAIALGVIPVAIPFQSFGGDEDGVLPWMAEALEGEEMPLVLPDSQEPPYEDIAAAAPDVILAAYSGITEEEYDLLSEIAPVVAYPGDAWATPGPRRGAT